MRVSGSRHLNGFVSSKSGITSLLLNWKSSFNYFGVTKILICLELAMMKVKEMRLWSWFNWFFVKLWQNCSLQWMKSNISQRTELTTLWFECWCGWSRVGGRLCSLRGAVFGYLRFDRRICSREIRKFMKLKRIQNLARKVERRTFNKIFEDV